MRTSVAPHLVRPLQEHLDPADFQPMRFEPDSPGPDLSDLTTFTESAARSEYLLNEKMRLLTHIHDPLPIDQLTPATQVLWRQVAVRKTLINIDRMVPGSSRDRQLEAVNAEFRRITGQLNDDEIVPDAHEFGAKDDDLPALDTSPDAEPSALPQPLKRGSRWVIDSETDRIESEYYGRRYELSIHALDAKRNEEWRAQRKARAQQAERGGGRNGGT